MSCDSRKLRDLLLCILGAPFSTTIWVLTVLGLTAIYSLLFIRAVVSGIGTFVESIFKGNSSLQKAKENISTGFQNSQNNIEEIMEELETHTICCVYPSVVRIANLVATCFALFVSGFVGVVVGLVYGSVVLTVVLVFILLAVVSVACEYLN